MGDYTFSIDKPVESYNRSDNSFLVSVIFMLGFGLFTLYFCSQASGAKFFGDSFYFVRRQIICILAGGAGFLVLSLVPMETIRKMIPALLFITIILCICTYIKPLSVERNGARRWLKIPFGGFTLQTSEVVKFTLIIFLSNFFEKYSSKPDSEDKSVLGAVAVMVLLVGFVLTQKDLSTSVFLYFFACGFFWCCGMKVRWFWFLSFIVMLLFCFYVLNQQYRIERIISFMNPNEGLTAGNFQSMSAKRAISAGGFWGAGIGSSLVQSNKIPEVQADYIFASWAEAMGLGGVIIYFCILGFFALRGLKVAFECTDRFASYVSFGFISMIVLQSLVNIAVVCGALPTTGIPLPFFSSGGSSEIFSLCMCGFVLNASRCNSENENDVVKIKNDDFIKVDTINGVDVYE